MRIKPPLLAQLVGDPTSPHERIILPKPEPELAKLSRLKGWHNSLDQYAARTAVGRTTQLLLDFKAHERQISEVLDDLPPIIFWPEGLFIPGNADYKNYWFFPPPDSNRYNQQWISGNDVNQASAADSHVWAYTAINQYMPHDHSEAGIGFLFSPHFKLAAYQVRPSVSVLGTYRWSIETNYNGGGWIYEWGAIYIAAWNMSPVDGSLELVKPFGVTTVFNESWLNQGAEPITNVVPPWSPGSLSTNLLLEGGKTYLIGVIVAVDVMNTWNVQQGQWPDGSDWRTWCTLFLTMPKVQIDTTTIYQQ
jgi:hypothetical protein